MLGKVVAAVLAGGTVVVLASCASSSPRTQRAGQPVVDLGHGTEIPLANATTNARSLPATALFSSGPYDLSAKLRSYGMSASGAAIWIDGTRQIGIEALDAYTLDDILRVELVRGVWGGLSGNADPPNVLAITTKRGAAAKK